MELQIVCNASTIQFSAACPVPWTKLSTGCYLFEENEATTWSKARDLCKEEGGRFVEIESQEEQETIENHMSTYGLQNMNFWIGLNDITQEGNWVWDSSQRPDDTGFTNWAIRQPDDYEQNEDCAELINIGGGYQPAKWADVPCSRRNHALCE